MTLSPLILDWEISTDAAPASHNPTMTGAVAKVASVAVANQLLAK